jgi:16S rRNA (cytidine1402-2'-O)-methyltransferase
VNGILYIVSTPIGNLGDFSFRAVEILNSVDLIATEDTRQTKKLLRHYSIETKMISYHEWNEIERALELCKLIKDGKKIALVTDAGTPCISDPGFRIVRETQKQQLAVYTIPGACAVISALSISGLPSDHFFFEGFLPKKKGRKTRLEFLKTLDASIVLYESPHRILKTLKDINSFLGNRYVSISRELTKKFEEVETRKVEELIQKYDEKKAKGEFVIVIAKKGFDL